MTCCQWHYTLLGKLLTDMVFLGWFIAFLQSQLVVFTNYFKRNSPDFPSCMNRGDTNSAMVSWLPRYVRAGFDSISSVLKHIEETN